VNQLLDFISQYKDYIILAIVIIGVVIGIGKVKVRNFVINELKKLEKEVIDSIKSNPIAFATAVYSHLPVSLKAFATTSTIVKIVIKFLDK
jgi:hypothetical protein